MQAIYRKAVRWIYPRYEASAWFRLAFILAFDALAMALAWAILSVLGTSHITAVVLVVMVLSVSWLAACMVYPGYWIAKEGIGGA